MTDVLVAYLERSGATPPRKKAGAEAERIPGAREIRAARGAAFGREG